MKTCKNCLLEKAEDDFPFRSDTKTYRLSCRVCDAAMRYDRGFGPRSKQAQKNQRARGRARSFQQRRDPAFRAKHIVFDTRQADRKKEREHDLTEDFVASLIEKGCSYCGDNNLMTVDRVDNQLGHTKANVVPACYRCNMLRGNMPYNAWMNISPSIRDTREKGLFGDWIGTRDLASFNRKDFPRSDNSAEEVEFESTMRGISPHDGFQDRCLQPLSHSSAESSLDEFFNWQSAFGSNEEPPLSESGALTS